MKQLVLLWGIFVCFSLSAQPTPPPQLLFDGLPSGSVYTGSAGVVSVAGRPEYRITKYNLVIGKEAIVSPSTPLSEETMAKIKALPTGTEIRILATVYFKKAAYAQIAAVYYAP